MPFSGAGNKQAGSSDNTVVDNAQSNRILLILAGVLVLLVFMDYQARRHYSQLADSFGTNQAGVARERLQSATESLGEPIKIQAAELLGSVQAGASDAAAHGADTIGAALRENLDEANLKEIVSDGVGSGSDRISTDNVRSNNIEESPVDSGALAAAVHPPAQVYLYFIRFRNSRSELVRVRRPASDFRLAGGRLLLTEVIARLKSGPTTRETGLINAFDNRVEIKSIYLDPDNGLVDLDVNDRIGRLGTHVIRDRLDQLIFTLTQFPEVGGVRLSVNGQRVRTIGSQQVPIAAILRPSDRIYHDYQ